jgi:polyhydroxybutyrate depolymerase
MKNTFIFAAMALCLASFSLSQGSLSAQSSSSQETSALQAAEFHFRYQGMDRTYYMYVPDGIKQNSPLVFVLHGYGGHAKGYEPRMMVVAKENGFAVCYPQGAKDGKGKTCWNVGYPFQEGLKTDDVGFVCSLAKYLQKHYDLSKANTFLTGMSNGGEMCYLLAYKRPDAFGALAPIAGLTLNWMIQDLTPKKAIPLMEVHGTADVTSYWVGDPTNKYGWGAYMNVPMAVNFWAAQAKCTHEEVIQLPLIPGRNQVTLHKYLGDTPAWKGGPAIEVRLYEVTGGPHSWSDKDMDTCAEVWSFFKQYLR